MSAPRPELDAAHPERREGYHRLLLRSPAYVVLDVKETVAWGNDVRAALREVEEPGPSPEAHAAALDALEPLAEEDCAWSATRGSTDCIDLDEDERDGAPLCRSCAARAVLDMSQRAAVMGVHNGDATKADLAAALAEVERLKANADGWVAHRGAVRAADHGTVIDPKAIVAKVAALEAEVAHLREERDRYRVEGVELAAEQAEGDANVGDAIMALNFKVAALEAERDAQRVKVPVHVCVVCQSEADPSVWPDDGSGPKCEPCVALAAALDALEPFAEDDCAWREVARGTVDCIDLNEDERDGAPLCQSCAARAVLTANNREVKP